VAWVKTLQHVSYPAVAESTRTALAIQSGSDPGGM
jgi:hypothetical protein